MHEPRAEEREEGEHAQNDGGAAHAEGRQQEQEQQDERRTPDERIAAEGDAAIQKAAAQQPRGGEQKGAQIDARLCAAMAAFRLLLLGHAPLLFPLFG